MKIFTCSACQHVTFFENSQCTRCGHALAYLPDREVLSAFEPLAVGATSPGEAGITLLALDAGANNARYRLCRNYTTHAVCNWAIPEHDPHEDCLACRLNAADPELPDAAAVDSWHRLEIAKRRLVYTLIDLGLPIETKQDQPETGLAFAFKADAPNGEPVLTAHADGLITINLKEADAPERERTRVQLGERYRTLLGHFRHESGHYYWDRLVKDSDWMSGFRELFGNEEEDYAEAVKRHYASPKQNWQEQYVSAYATMHPWEDWAETWAHYLHMADTLETAQSYGLVLKPQAVGGAKSESVMTRRLRLDDFAQLIAVWVPLTVALNSLNRSMGLPDLYPFVLAEAVIAKLQFVHQVVEQAARGVHAHRAAPPSAPQVSLEPRGGQPAQALNPA